MSFTVNQIITPSIDPNCPAGPTGPTGPTGPIGPPGCAGTTRCAGNPGTNSSNCTLGPTGSNGQTCHPGVNIALPVGQTITIPYTSSGWFYGINITLPPAEKKVIKIKDDRDGCDCTKCKTFFEFAEPNQEDGTLICWACRHGY